MTLIKQSMITAAALTALAASLPATANTTAALKACKAEIASDARFAEQRVDSRMDSLKTRGRYTQFTIDVRASDGNGDSSEWLATCKARNTGKIESLDIAQVNGSELQVADN